MEIAVVVVIIALITTIAIVGFVQIQKQARDKKRETDVDTIMTGLEKYFDKNGEYPTDELTYYYSSNGQAGANYQASTSPMLGQNTNLNTIKTLIRSGVGENFGEPLRTASNTNYFDASNVGVKGSYARYFYLGGAVTKTSGGGSYGGVANFFKPDGSAAFSCNYWMDANTGDASGYIIGYYSEIKGAYIFKRSMQGNKFRWNSNNEARCNLSN